MDITGIKHHENMWSDIYSFFFNVNEEHNMKDLFIRSLENVLRREKRNQPIEMDFLKDFKVEREYAVTGQQRIDLLLKDDINHRAIIIENKVYHTLDNNLDNYYKSIKKDKYGDVIVIVLGLTKYRLKPIYYSITHIELLEEVFSNLPKYLAEANPKHIYLLQEFYKNIKNHTNMIDKEVAAFFIKEENRKKIPVIHDIYRQVKDYLMMVMECKEKSPIKDHIKRLKLTPQPEKTGKGEEYVKYIFNKNNKMMLTVFYKNNILRPKVGERPHIQIVLEIQGDIKRKVETSLDKYLELLETFKSEGVSLNSKKGKEWWHFSSMDIPVNDLTTFPEVVSEAINENCPLLKLGYAILDEIQKE